MRKWIEKNAVGLTLLLVLAVMAMIFGFSCQNGEESGRLSGTITKLLLRVFVPDYAALDPARQQLLAERAGFFVRKAAHLTEFAFLGFSLMLHFKTLERRGMCRRPALLSLLVGFAYAASDELHQILVSGRGPSLRDVGIDCLGVFLAVIVCLLCAAARRNRTGSAG